MKAFAELFDALDRTTSTNAKVDALADYFARVANADAAWAVFFLTGRRLKRLMHVRELATWVGEASGLPEWLIEESYASVGDLAETVALLLDGHNQTTSDVPLHTWIEERIAKLATLSEEQQRDTVLAWWQSLNGRELFLVNKLLTGAFRVGVSQTLVTKAIARVADLPAEAVAHRMMGNWDPTPEFAERQLVSPDVTDTDRSRPYPFFLASTLETAPDSLGAIAAFQAEWKWDGIRAQLVKRGGHLYLWSRGEELVTDRFPEISTALASVPEGTVIDGEIVAYRDGKPLAFGVLQQRIGRQKVAPKVLTDAPVVFMMYDLLEHDGVDLRESPLAERRAELEQLELPDVFEVSPIIAAADWQALARERAKARDMAVEGLMLKRRDSPYRTGRKRGDWWKWKIDPYSVDAVLIYAQPGSGRRSGLYTDYTFGVWHAGELTPVAKAYSGLDDSEIAKLDRWIRAHTTEKFGPVRAVEPVHVFGSPL